MNTIPLQSTNDNEAPFPRARRAPLGFLDILGPFLRPEAAGSVLCPTIVIGKETASLARELHQYQARLRIAG